VVDSPRRRRPHPGRTIPVERRPSVPNVVVAVVVKAADLVVIVVNLLRVRGNGCGARRSAPLVVVVDAVVIIIVVVVVAEPNGTDA
jgi:hypothetical protein